MSNTAPSSETTNTNSAAETLQTDYSSTLKNGYECETIEQLLMHLNSLAKKDGFALICDNRGKVRARSKKNYALGVAGERVNPRFICLKGNHIQKSKLKVYTEGESRKRDRQSRLKGRETACKYKIMFKLEIRNEDGVLRRIWKPSTESHEHNHAASCPLTTAGMTPHRRQWLLEHKELILDRHNDVLSDAKLWPR